jgi:hypothetical protein
MADVIAGFESNIRDDHDAPGARKLFEPPEVEDLGKLQEMTMLQGVTLEP